MGVAIYYLKARYPSNEKARAAADELLPYLYDLEKLELDWQRIRGHFNTPCEERLKTLLKKHPKGAEFLPADLHCTSSEDINMNFLAHVIPDVEPSRTEFDLVVKKNILYMKSWAWHLSNWNPIVWWLKEHGALGAGWLSSEHVKNVTYPGPKDWSPQADQTPFGKFSV
jgi:hypothetical protein